MRPPRRIFLVEDDLLIAMAMQEQLGALGYEACGHAAHGEAALAQIPQARADLVLMDVNLGGGLSGIDVAERLRGRCDAPVVFVTGYADPELVEGAARSGSFAYVVKPFQPLALRATIEMVLEKHALERRLREHERSAAEAHYRQRLLDELHHRVKNNLQTIASMLRLQFAEETAPRIQGKLRAALYRIEAMALIHEQLGAAGLDEEVDTGRYLRRLAAALTRVHAGAPLPAIEIVEAAPLDLSPEAFMNLGMIVCELLTNALRHAFAGRAPGRVRVSLGEHGAWRRLVIEDDGVGMGAGAEAGSLGLQIVRGLAQRLGGAVEIEAPRGGGARVTVRFPVA